MFLLKPSAACRGRLNSLLKSALSRSLGAGAKEWQGVAGFKISIYLPKKISFSFATTAVFSLKMEVTAF